MGMQHSTADRKVELGQFYTTHNPFIGEAFDEWISSTPDGPILEPFAGSGSLFKFINKEWVGFDIEPNGVDITRRDTLKDFPTGYRVCITNPPYLAKNVIKRKSLNVVITEEDLYLDCLNKCLSNCDYVAAIIPSTFLNKTKFHSRLSHFDKIDRKLFDSTDEPVCVAYFVPDPNVKTKYYVNGKELNFDSKDVPTKSNSLIKFNPKTPKYTLFAIDSIKGNSIRVERYNNEPIKGTNRHIVPFSCDDIDVQQLNKVINIWRDKTEDFFLTSFKSCKLDGTYRKRISFQTLNYLVYRD